MAVEWSLFTPRASGGRGGGSVGSVVGIKFESDFLFLVRWVLGPCLVGGMEFFSSGLEEIFSMPMSGSCTGEGGCLLELSGCAWGLCWLMQRKEAEQSRVAAADSCHPRLALLIAAALRFFPC